tara:strand:- start:6 stop:374 length:369 start_codon:yes stop_codon:yes gene_type:complete
MRNLKFFLVVMLSLFFLQQNLKANESFLLEEKISKNLRCLICQGQSIYDSQSDFAVSMKLLIKKKLEQGNSEDEIYQYLKNKYGEWIVYDPELNKKNLLLWAFPLILFIIGGILIFRKVFNN